jgi:hypothetical protein
VLIGENGCGKSNILESLAFASAAAQSKLDNEFLVSRGVRVAEPQFMRSAFAENEKDEILLSIMRNDGRDWSCRLSWESHQGQSRWWDLVIRDLVLEVGQKSAPEHVTIPEETVRNLAGIIAHLRGFSDLLKFLIYSPENTSLRTFEREGQIQPLGIKGEGLFKLLKILSHEDHRDRLADIKDNLRLFDWFGDFRIASDLAPFESSLQIQDRYLPEPLAYFDQRSANEGFLFLLFYFALFVSAETPSFFAIDNIAASLNKQPEPPRLPRDPHAEKHPAPGCRVDSVPLANFLRRELAESGVARRTWFMLRRGGHIT